jgi:hypothetical protein
MVVVFEADRLEEVLSRRRRLRGRYSQVVVLHAAIRIHLWQSEQRRVGKLKHVRHDEHEGRKRIKKKTGTQGKDSKILKKKKKKKKKKRHTLPCDLFGHEKNGVVSVFLFCFVVFTACALESEDAFGKRNQNRKRKN